MSEIVASRILASMFIGRYSQADNGSQIDHRLPNSHSYSGRVDTSASSRGCMDSKSEELHARKGEALCCIDLHTQPSIVPPRPG
jgi:hypothetical protein